MAWSEPAVAWLRGVAATAIVAALVCGFAGGALVSAGPARAHATLVASDPAEGSELAVPPSRVTATFNEPMQAQFAAMTVIGPDGQQYESGEPTVDDVVISVAVRAGGPAGDYTANYRATSADGHVVSGSWSYRVLAAPPSSAPKPASTEADPPPSTDPTDPTDPTDDSIPVWPFVAAATAVVAAGALWAVRRSS